MRAVRVDELGTPFKGEVAETPEPEPGPGAACVANIAQAIDKTIYRVVVFSPMQVA